VAGRLWYWYGYIWKARYIATRTIPKYQHRIYTFIAKAMATNGRCPALPTL